MHWSISLREADWNVRHLIGNMNDSQTSSELLTDEGIRCPECEYNLTGLSEDVCPECGESFDRERLLIGLERGSTEIPVWSRRRSRGLIRTFCATLFTIWVHPIRFAKQFPERPNRADAYRFSRLCLLVSVALWILMIGRYNIPSLADLLFLVLAGVELVLVVYLCEDTIIRFALATSGLTGQSRAEFRRHRVLVRMTRAFLVLSSAAAVIGDWLGPTMFRWFGSSVPQDPMIPIITVFVYWWVCLACMAYVMNFEMRSFLRAIIGVPIVTLVLYWISLFIAPLNSVWYFFYG